MIAGAARVDKLRAPAPRAPAAFRWPRRRGKPRRRWPDFMADFAGRAVSRRESFSTFEHGTAARRGRTRRPQFQPRPLQPRARRPAPPPTSTAQIDAQLAEGARGSTRRTRRTVGDTAANAQHAQDSLAWAAAMKARPDGTGRAPRIFTSQNAGPPTAQHLAFLHKDNAVGSGRGRDAGRHTQRMIRLAEFLHARPERRNSKTFTPRPGWFKTDRRPECGWAQSGPEPTVASTCLTRINSRRSSNGL